MMMKKKKYNSNKKYFNNYVYNTKISEKNISNDNIRNENITNFLNQCKIYLNPRNFECIVNIFQKFKNGFLNQETVISQIKNLLQNNRNLLKFLDSVFIIQ